MIKFMKSQRIDRIITIDAGLKLEGEKTGTIAEGVGIAMGGIGVDRYEIEGIAVKRRMPLDAVVIKVSDEEALMPMRKDIFDSVKNATEIVKESLSRSKKNERILIMGVGNTCGIGNDSKAVKEVETRVKRHTREQEKGKKKNILKF